MTKIQGDCNPELELRFKRVAKDPNWPLPEYGSAEASGMDLRADLDEPVSLAPGEIKLIPSGWSIAVPKGYEAQVRPRSGLALRQGLTIINTPGTIDSDYRGEMGLAMINLGKNEVVINRGDRLAQLIINKVERPKLVLIEELDQTARGSGGFGSTGVG